MSKRKPLNWSPAKQLEALDHIIELEVQVGELLGQLERALEDIDALEGEMQAIGETDA